MANQRRAPFPYKGQVGRKGCFTFFHTVTLTAAGAILSQDADSGVTAAKQGGAGLYTLTFPAAYKKVVGLRVGYIGVLTTGTGNQLDWENNNLDGGTKAGTIQAQFRRNDTMAVADVPSGIVLKFEIEVEEGV
jgi:hypothetical protein